jgi:uncharacterized membrane protein
VPATWRRGEGITLLPTFPGQPLKGIALTISADGSTIGGYAGITANSANRGAIWSGDSAPIMVMPPADFPATSSTEITGLNNDGTLAVGTVIEEALSGNSAGFKWTLALGAVTFAPKESIGISDDSRVIFGSYWDGTSAPLAWAAVDGQATFDQPDRQPVINEPRALACSASGNVAVGWSRTNRINSFGYNVYDAFIWDITANTPIDLGELEPLTGGQARAVSGDGSVVVGSGSDAFIWDAARGMRNLVTVLQDEYHADLSGIPYIVPWAMSRDAHWIGSDGILIHFIDAQPPCSEDFDGDGDVGTDADIEAFFACLAGSCCATCGSADFNGDGDVGTDADIESFFRVLAGGAC